MSSDQINWKTRKLRKAITVKKYIICIKPCSVGKKTRFWQLEDCQVGDKVKWASDCDQCHKDPDYTEGIISAVHLRS